MRVRRLSLPAPLAAGLQSWQARLKGVRAGSAVIGERWEEFTGDPLRADVTALLNEQTRRKCVYCEHDSPSKVDHFYPKLKYPRKTFTWNNFNWSCTDCNFFKGPHLQLVGTRPRLLNPMEERTEELIYINPETGIMSAADGLDDVATDRVTHTISKLKLNERNFPEARKLTAKGLYLAIETYVETGSAKAEEAVLLLLSEAQPMCAVLRQMIRDPDDAIRTTVEACLKRSIRVRQYVRKRKWIR